MSFTNEEKYILKELVELDIFEINKLLEKEDVTDKKSLEKHIEKLNVILKKLETKEK